MFNVDLKDWDEWLLKNKYVAVFNTKNGLYEVDNGTANFSYRVKDNLVEVSYPITKDGVVIELNPKILDLEKLIKPQSD